MQLVQHYVYSYGLKHDRIAMMIHAHYWDAHIHPDIDALIPRIILIVGPDHRAQVHKEADSVLEKLHHGQHFWSE